jgi:hypothetical protein
MLALIPFAPGFPVSEISTLGIVKDIGKKLRRT